MKRVLGKGFSSSLAHLEPADSEAPRAAMLRVRLQFAEVFHMGDYQRVWFVVPHSLQRICDLAWLISEKFALKQRTQRGYFLLILWVCLSFPYTAHRSAAFCRRLCSSSYPGHRSIKGERHYQVCI